jgi:hypothetical protein
MIRITGHELPIGTSAEDASLPDLSFELEEWRMGIAQAGRNHGGLACANRLAEADIELAGAGNNAAGEKSVNHRAVERGREQTSVHDAGVAFAARRTRPVGGHRVVGLQNET